MYFYDEDLAELEVFDNIIYYENKRYKIYEADSYGVYAKEILEN